MKKILSLILALAAMAIGTSCSCDRNVPAVYSSPTEISTLKSPEGNKYHLSTFIYEDHRYLLIENDYGLRYARFQVIELD